MKKYLFAGLLILMLAVSGMAADYGAPTGKVVNVVFNPESGVKTLMSAQTATGDSALGGIDMGYTSKYFTCYATWTLAPTSADVYILGSIDNSVYAATADALATFAMTYTPKYISAFGSPFRYLKAYYNGKTGSAASGDITIKCVAGGN